MLNTLLRTLAQGFFLALALSYYSSSHAFSFMKEEHIQRINQRYPQIGETMIRSGLNAYEHALERNLTEKTVVTLVDYSKPSNAKRLWVIDLSNDRLVFEDYVAHGAASGDRYARHFSNRSGSHQSSYGVFLTESPYMGSHGYSLRLKGLEKGFNDHAESRAIVIHSAWYATKQFADRYGRIGRSWGCFAVNEHLIKPLIQKIKEGSLLVAYYPNSYWLHHSAFVR